MKKELLSSEDMQRLFEAVLKLETMEEAQAFFTDIATIAELRLWAQRLEVARLLQANMTYVQIEGKTGASTATISRVKRFLQYGSGGYGLILARLGK